MLLRAVAKKLCKGWVGAEAVNFGGFGEFWGEVLDVLAEDSEAAVDITTQRSDATIRANVHDGSFLWMPF